MEVGVWGGVSPSAGKRSLIPVVIDTMMIGYESMQRGFMRVERLVTWLRRIWRGRI